jgi:hypothetical protein
MGHITCLYCALEVVTGHSCTAVVPMSRLVVMYAMHATPHVTKNDQVVTDRARHMWHLFKCLVGWKSARVPQAQDRLLLTHNEGPTAAFELPSMGLVEATHTQ